MSTFAQDRYRMQFFDALYQNTRGPYYYSDPCRIPKHIGWGREVVMNNLSRNR
jgi:hypothetical protein